jgi:hypothetical protein
MKFNLKVDHYKGEWRVLNLQPSNDWQVSFGEFSDAYKFLIDIVSKEGLN